jgi:hypothetical protein
VEWLRLYDGIIDDPKILALSRADRWSFVALLCVASRQNERGTLPNLREIALHLRIRTPEAEKLISRFVDMGFIDASDDKQTLCIHGWDRRQFKSDDVTARTKASKERSRERSHPSTGERASRARSETDSETEKKNPIPSNSISGLGGDASRVRGDVAGTVHESPADKRARERAEMSAAVERLRNGKA